MRILRVIIFLIIGTVHGYAALEAQPWAIIDNKSVNLTKSCRMKFGLFASDNLCRCCLAQGKYKSKNEASVILKSCLRHKSCTEKTLNNALQLNLKTANDEEISARIKEAIPLVHFVNLDKINLSPEPQRQNDGSFLTQNHVEEIIRYLAKNKLIDLSSPLTSKDCLKVTSLTEGKGYNTGQLFSIKVNRLCGQNDEQWEQIYIFKEVTQALKELLNLEKIKNNPRISKVIKGEGPDGVPVITTDLVNFKISHAKKEIYFSLLESAKGKPLSGWIKQYGEALTKNEASLPALQKTMEKMFYNIGYQLSKLHQYLSVRIDKKHTTRNLLKNTIIHGDFHANNIFYDDKDQTVYLIDNESMANSIKKTLPGTHELAYLYALTTFKTIAYKASDQFKTNLTLNIPDKAWHHLWQKLIVGYIAAYPEDSWNQIEKEMQKSFVQHMQYLKSTNFQRFFDKRFLALLFGERGRRNQLIHEFLPIMFKNVHQELANTPLQ